MRAVKRSKRKATTIGVRVTTAQRAYAERKAESVDLSMSEWMASLLERERIQELAAKSAADSAAVELIADASAAA